MMISELDSAAGSSYTPQGAPPRGRYGIADTIFYAALKSAPTRLHKYSNITANALFNV